jgi:hypothetical protein
MTVEGKAFLAVYLYAGLGLFCGPIMSNASSWSRSFPGGLTSLASFTIAAGSMIFTSLEDLSRMEAIYASIIAGKCCFVFLSWMPTNE